MVKETRIVFEPTDILQQRIVCSACRGEIVRPRTKTEFKLPTDCPNCGTEWSDPHGQKDPVIEATKSLLSALHYLQTAPIGKAPPFTARFEIDGEQDK